ncbi:MAG TPA: rhodanese domain-containing protein [Sphingobium sp.]|nr:rhodanese domain-containing protein [Sphingobium sp.]
MSAVPPSSAPAPLPPVRVAAFYCFAPVADPAGLAAVLRAFGRGHDLVGSIIVAGEGANGTIAGAPHAVDGLLERLRAEPGFAALAPRLHTAEVAPFARWKVKVKPEIVTMGVPGIDAANAGIHVAPADWNALIADPDVILIDARNDYEVALGRFAGAVDPGTASFGDFPAWFDAQAEQWRAQGRTPRVAMYCTGGIRCEKSTAFARARGFDEVYHLKGGILAYLAEVEERNSLWRGECFLFDERVSIGHGERIGDVALCTGCGQPIAPADETATESSASQRARCRCELRAG